MAISFGLLLARATALMTVTAGLLTLASVATSQVSDSARPMTAAGCLVNERDYAAARGLARPLASSDAQLVIVLAKDAARDIAMDGIVLTGRQEAALARDAGRQITLDGILEPPLTASPAFTAREPEDEPASISPSGAVGTTPAGSPAHEPSDAASVAGAADDPARSPDGALRARPSSLADLARLNVTASRNAGERCALDIVPQAAASPGASVVSVASGVQQNTAAAAVPPTPRASAPDAGTPITVIGCLVREDVPDGSGASYLAVVGTVTGAGTSRVQGSAVPGSFPSGTGSGTIGTTGTSSNVQPWAFRLVTSDPAVARRVGQRVEVVGTAERVDAGVNNARNAPTATTAHTTAPTRQIRVTSVRAASGSCQ